MASTQAVGGPGIPGPYDLPMRMAEARSWAAFAEVQATSQVPTGGDSRETVLRSDELNCPSCISKIETALDKIDGVEQAKVHFATGRIDVDHHASRSAVSS